MTTTLTTTTKDLTIAQPLDQNPAAVYLSSLSKGSRRTMQQALDDIAGLLTRGQATAFDLNWAALRFQHTNAIRSKLAERYSAATANKMLSALRGTLDAAFNLGQLSAEDYLRAKSLKAVKGSSEPEGRALTTAEIESLMRACADDDHKLAAVRDGAMLAILFSCGLRRAELCSLDLADYEPDGSLVVRKGKGNKSRRLYVADGARKWLLDYLAVRGESSGPLFIPVLKSGIAVMGRRLTTQAVWVILAKRAEQAGVKDVSPHDFRRSFISKLLDNGVDIGTVQKLAGHSLVQTTLRYDRRDESAKQEAVKTIKVPYYKA